MENGELFVNAYTCKMRTRTTLIGHLYCKAGGNGKRIFLNQGFVKARGPGGLLYGPTGGTKELITGAYFSSTSLRTGMHEWLLSKRQDETSHVHLDAVELMVDERIGRLGSSSHVGHGHVVHRIRVESNA